MNIEEFIGKIEWEGGIAQAMEYGLGLDDLDSEDIDANPDFVDAWRECARSYMNFDYQRDRLDRIMAQIDTTTIAG